jgi:hypothetical protein
LKASIPRCNIPRLARDTAPLSRPTALLGGLIDVFEKKSFALVFILLLCVPALLPTGGATHVFEIIAILVALQLVAGRDAIPSHH